MSHRRSSPLLSALGAATMIVIVGCGGSASTTSSSSSATAATSSASAATSSAAVPSSAAATASPSELPAASSPASLPSLPAIFSNHADPALEDQLPAEVSGTALQRYSLPLSDVLDSGWRPRDDRRLPAGDRQDRVGWERRGCPRPDQYADRRDPGLQGQRRRQRRRCSRASCPVEQSDLGGGATKRQATVGGKSVTIVSVGTGVNDTEWIYGRGDVVFVVHATDETHAAAFLQALS